ncbi:MAG: nitroreductase family deazaflavin-dependent oxidoreductase [Anaerolineales bacterium]
MNDVEDITPPQPIPYPRSEFIKRLYRIPILLYRLGLSSMIGKYILILSTFGRNSGKTRRTPVEYFRWQDRIFVMSGFGENPDWYKNLLANPHVTIHSNQGYLCAIARKPETEKEWEGVVAYLKSSPITKLTIPDLIGRLDKPEVRQAIKSWPVFTFDPTEETCPPHLEIDLLWCWPLILLGLALKIFTGWLCHHKN